MATTAAQPHSGLQKTGALPPQKLDVKSLICHRGNVKTIGPKASIRDVAKLMKDNNIGFVPIVCERTGNLMGTLTDRDLVVRLLASANVDPRVLENIKADEVMTKDIVFVRESEATIDRVETLMRQHKIRRLLVVDDANKPLGVISLTDLLVKEHELSACQTIQHLKSSHPSA